MKITNAVVEFLAVIAVAERAYERTGLELLACERRRDELLDLTTHQSAQIVALEQCLRAS